MMFILSVFSVFVVKTLLAMMRGQGAGRSTIYEAGKLLRSSCMAASIRRGPSICGNVGVFIFELGEKELVLYLIFMSKSGVFESQMEEALSVVINVRKQLLKEGAPRAGSDTREGGVPGRWIAT